MKLGRRLLFHRNNIDDNIGTYVTDYVIGAGCLLICSALVYKVFRRKSADDERVRSSWRDGDPSNCHYWLPWNWPRPIVTSINMTTYATIAFIISYGLMMFMGGFPHQFLQKVEPYNNWQDSWGWLIMWRTAAGFVAIALPSMLTMLDQTLHQEGLCSMRRGFRQIYYCTLAILGIFTVAANFYRLGDQKDPYDIERIYLAFVSCILLYGIAMLAVAIRVHCCCSRKSGEDELKVAIEPTEDKVSSKMNEEMISRSNVRWDLILHCLVPWIMVFGGVFSYVLTPLCSHHDQAQKAHGCPLPDEFNHNAVMHLVQLGAMVVVGFAENIAINRRHCDAISNSDVKDDNETESLASTV